MCLLPIAMYGLLEVALRFRRFAWFLMYGRVLKLESNMEKTISSERTFYLLKMFTKIRPCG